VVCRIDCLAYKNELLENNLLDVKKNSEHALDLALHTSRLFAHWLETSMSFKRLPILARVSVALSSIFAQNLMHTRYLIHGEIALGQIHGS
jgi:hypothetical protein